MKPRWTRLATLGLLMIAAGPALLLAAVLIYGLDFSGGGGFFVPLIAGMLIALVGAFMVWRFGRWSKFVGIIAALLGTAPVFWTAFGVVRPGSFFDFVPGILVMPGFLIAVISCIGAIVAGRRVHIGAATGGERVAIRGVLGLVLLLAAASAVLTWTGQSSVSEADAPETIVDLGNNAFSPKELDIGQGESILLRNDDPFFHTFTIDALSIDQAFTPGDEVVLRVPDEPGTYIFYCRPHTFNPEDPESDDMAGTLTVE